LQADQSDSGSDRLRAPFTEGDRRAAQRFADCCYDDTLRMPTRKAMERLLALGVVVLDRPGAYAETPLLRQLGF